MSATQRMGSILLVVFAVIVGGAWQAAEKPQPVQKWEYKQVAVRNEPELQFDRLTSDLGEQGWELVAVTGNATYPYLYFKRPKQ